MVIPKGSTTDGGINKNADGTKRGQTVNALFDEEQLRKLIANLDILTGLPANILDTQGRDLCLFSGHPPFCKAINAVPEGHRRCVECDAWKVGSYDSDGGFQYFRCHAGICEAVMPLFDKRWPLAYLVFGCYLDDSPIEEQWDRTAALLDWYSGSLDELHEAFLQLHQRSEREIQAYAETLEALADYIRLKKMILTAEESDLQRLERYLDQHYMEKLSLESISKALHIGRTKLCTLARELSGGRTLSHLIAHRRIDAAKLLLLQSSQPISAIAEAVGIADYNYFSRVFRSGTGMTPSEFRKNGRKGLQTPERKSKI